MISILLLFEFVRAAENLTTSQNPGSLSLWEKLCIGGSFIVLVVTIIVYKCQNGDNHFGNIFR